MQTLLVSYSGLLGGAERILLDAATRLDRPVTLACPEGALATQARAAGLTVVVFKERSLRLRGGPRIRAEAAAGLAGHVREVGRVVRRTGPGVVVAWSLRPALAMPVALAGLRRPPVLVVVHNDLLPPGVVGGAARRALARAALVCVPSAAVAADLDPDGGLADRLRVVPPGTDLARFSAIADLPPDVGPAPRVLTMGALVEWKRPDLALEAVAIARRHIPDLRLTLAGGPIQSGNQRAGGLGRFDGAAGYGSGSGLLERLRERAARPDLAGHAEILGRDVDAADQLAAATCLLHTAPLEPFGMVVVEALAAGRPAVVPDAGGPAEIVTPGCGIRYAAGDPAAAAAALVDLLRTHGRAARLGAGGRKRAATDYTADDWATRLAAVLDEATEGARP